MKACLIIAGVLAIAMSQHSPAYFNRIPLPDGVDLIVGQVKSTFSCHQRDYGYYADVQNQCTIFHVCKPGIDEIGNPIVDQFAFFCANLTSFNQLTLSCDHSENVKCEGSEDFYEINRFFGQTDKPLQDDHHDRLSFRFRHF